MEGRASTRVQSNGVSETWRICGCVERDVAGVNREQEDGGLVTVQLGSIHVGGRHACGGHVKDSQDDGGSRKSAAAWLTGVLAVISGLRHLAVHWHGDDVRCLGSTRNILATCVNRACPVYLVG